MVYPPPLNVVGFIEVVFRISHLFKAYQKVKEAWHFHKPDLLILIDYPDMNLRLAKAAHKEKIPVLYYISPQVWAWRSGRVKNIARYVDRLAVILPFEVAFYKTFGVRVEFVGHPLLDRIRNETREREIPSPVDSPGQILIGLLPGSRPAEIKAILPTLLETAALLTRQYGQRIRFILPVAGTLDFKPDPGKNPTLSRTGGFPGTHIRGFSEDPGPLSSGHCGFRDGHPGSGYPGDPDPYCL